MRHHEFYKPEFAAHTKAALKTGLARAADLAKGAADWEQTPGRRVLGYKSSVDESYQPYALSLPAAFGKEPERSWPLHVVLHGRGATLNEVAKTLKKRGALKVDVWVVVRTLPDAAISV